MSTVTNDKILPSCSTKEKFHESSGNWQFLAGNTNIETSKLDAQSSEIEPSAPRRIETTESVSSYEEEEDHGSSGENHRDREDTNSDCPKCSTSSPLLVQEDEGSSTIKRDLRPSPHHHRLSAGTAFVPLSDRIPRFLRAHHDSEFVIMATPKAGGTKRSRSSDRSDYLLAPTSPPGSEPEFMDRRRRRSSLVASQEDFQYCSATRPLHGIAATGRLYQRNPENFKKKQTRPLFKSDESSDDGEGQFNFNSY